ncbi:MAG: hypothetical protein LBM70_02060 [Victivallales bacterium]|jgi:hypothetical protein|nr:hypothetical protein [Victivallales bacterium]
MKRIEKILLVIAAASLLGVIGCATTAEPNRTDANQLSKEGNVVFTRPPDFSIFGTTSISDYIEVLGDRFYANEAGQPVAEITLRNRGRVHWYNALSETPENIVLMAQANFYDKESSERHNARLLYSTNRRKILLKRGLTTRMEFVSPVVGARGFQVILSEETPLKATSKNHFLEVLY